MEATGRTGERRRDLAGRARLYLCLGALPDEPLAALLGKALGGGVGIVQLRDPDATDEELLAAATVFRRLADEHDALFLVNDRPDIALAAGADGVHVGQDDETPEAVRRTVGEDVLIGLSTHSPGELRAAMRSPADLLSVGPVWETPTKPGRPAAGLEYVRHAAAAVPRQPWFAIGGIDRSNLDEVLAAGATRIVVVRAILEASDPGAAARDLHAALDARATAGAAH